MRSRIRLFVLVGFLATSIDVLFFLQLHKHFGSIVFSDIGALLVAAPLAYLLDKYLTFGGDPTAKWVSSPWLFALTAFFAGCVDVSILWILHLVDIPLFWAKLIAIFFAAILRWLSYRRILFGVVRTELQTKVLRDEPSGSLQFSVVIPAYNEGVRIEKTVSAVQQALSSLGEENIEIVVVDDGSEDNTAERARRSGAVVVEQDRNRGKGAAVRAGVLASRGRTVAFTDADLAYPPSLLLSVLDEVEDGWDIIVGSRRHKATKTLVKAKKLRQVGGWFVNRLTHVVLLGKFRDTQCGIKGFRGDVGRAVLERCKIEGFAFDVEIFLIAEQDGLSLKEMPVMLENRAGSSVSLIADTFALVGDLFRIRRWAGNGGYAPSSEQQKVLEPVQKAVR